MRAPIFAIGCVSFLMVAALLTGCEAGQRAKQRKENFEDLKQLGLTFFNYHDQHQRAPKSWEEYQEGGLDAGMRDRLSAEGYTVVMGVDIRSMSVGTSNFMMAFQRLAEREGGQVLFADGSVRVITPEEFKEKMDLQADNMQGAVIFEPAAGKSSGAGVISAPAGGNSSDPPLPPRPPAQ